MAKLFVMNCKSQDESFSYRVPEGEVGAYRPGRVMTQTVPKGGQVQIYRDESEPVLRAIMDQHHKYGVVEANEVDRTRPFINLVFQLNRPFTPDQILYGFQHNTDVLTERGEEQRNNAAVAIGGNLDRVAAEHGRRVTGSELELVDETTGDDNSGLATKIIVDPAISKNEHGKRQKGRPRADR